MVMKLQPCLTIVPLASKVVVGACFSFLPKTCAPFHLKQGKTLQASLIAPAKEEKGMALFRFEDSGFPSTNQIRGTYYLLYVKGLKRGKKCLEWAQPNKLASVFSWPTKLLRLLSWTYSAWTVAVSWTEHREMSFELYELPPWLAHLSTGQQMHFCLECIKSCAATGATFLWGGNRKFSLPILWSSLLHTPSSQLSCRSPDHPFQKYVGTLVVPLFTVCTVAGCATESKCPRMLKSSIRTSVVKHNYIFYPSI